MSVFVVRPPTELTAEPADGVRLMMGSAADGVRPMMGSGWGGYGLDDLGVDGFDRVSKKPSLVFSFGVGEANASIPSIKMPLGQL